MFELAGKSNQQEQSAVDKSLDELKKEIVILNQDIKKSTGIEKQTLEKKLDELYEQMDVLIEQKEGMEKGEIAVEQEIKTEQEKQIDLVEKFSSYNNLKKTIKSIKKQIKTAEKSNDPDLAQELKIQMQELETQKKENKPSLAEWFRRHKKIFYSIMAISAAAGIGKMIHKYAEAAPPSYDGPTDLIMGEGEDVGNMVLAGAFEKPNLNDDEKIQIGSEKISRGEYRQELEKQINKYIKDNHKKAGAESCNGLQCYYYYDDRLVDIDDNMVAIATGKPLSLINSSKKIIQKGFAHQERGIGAVGIVEVPEGYNELPKSEVPISVAIYGGLTNVEADKFLDQTFEHRLAEVEYELSRVKLDEMPQGMKTKMEGHLIKFVKYQSQIDAERQMIKVLSKNHQYDSIDNHVAKVNELIKKQKVNLKKYHKFFHDEVPDNLLNQDLVLSENENSVLGNYEINELNELREIILPIATTEQFKSERLNKVLDKLDIQADKIFKSTKQDITQKQGVKKVQTEVEKATTIAKPTKKVARKR